MAVNRKGGKPPNKFSEDDFGLADVGRIMRGLEQKPASLRMMEERYDTAMRGKESLDQMANLDPNITKTPAYSKPMMAHRKTLANLEPRIALYNESRLERSHSQAVNTVGREFSDSSVNSYAQRGQNSLASQATGLNMAANNSFSQLDERQEFLRKQMSATRSFAMGQAGKLVNSDGSANQAAVEKLQKSQGHFKMLAGEYRDTQAGMNQLKREGLDPASKTANLTKAAQGAEGVLAGRKIEEMIQNKEGLGKFSVKELKEKEADAATKLIKAMNDFRTATDRSKENLNKLNTAAEEAAKELKEVQDVQAAGGGKGGKDDSAKIIAGALAEAMNIITAGVQTLMITQPMQQVANTTASANIENSKYDMWRAAVGGDMTARLNLGGVAHADEFGQLMYDRTKYTHGTAIAGHALAGGAGLLQAGEVVAGAGGTLVGNSRVEAGAQAGKAILSGLVGGTVEVNDWANHITQTQNRNAGYNAMMSAVKALNHIPGHQLQQYRNYAMSNNQAADFMGADSEGFLNRTGGADFMGKLKGVGVGIEEFGALAAQGSQAMGSRFNESQVIDSVKLENMGFYSAQQNMKNMGVLGAAGSQDPSTNLQKLIEEGMSRGLNSSKAIEMIVDNTARMTESTARAGVSADPTEFLTRSILSAMDKNNPNKEMAASIAYQTYQSEEGHRHNTAASFAGMVNVQSAMEGLGLKTDRASGVILSSMPTEMLNAYKGKGPDALKSFLEGRGVNVRDMDQSLFENDKLIDIMNKAGSISELNRSSGIGLVSGNSKQLLEEIGSAKDPRVRQALISGNDEKALTEEQRTLRQNVARGITLENPNANPGAIIGNAAILGGYAPKDETAKTLAELAPNTTRGEAQTERRLGNVQAMGAGEQGARLLGEGDSGAASIKALANTGRVAFERAGKHAEEAWSKAAADTATNFGKSANSLNSAAGRLDTVTKDLMAGTQAYKVVGERLEKVLEDMQKKAGDNKVMNWFREHIGGK